MSGILNFFWLVHQRNFHFISIMFCRRGSSSATVHLHCSPQLAFLAAAAVQTYSANLHTIATLYIALLGIDVILCTSLVACCALDLIERGCNFPKCCLLLLLSCSQTLLPNPSLCVLSVPLYKLLYKINVQIALKLPHGVAIKCYCTELL